MQKNIIVIATIILSILGCKKNTDDNIIPNTSVNISINLNDPSFINLTNIGGWVYVTGGVRGILVYRKSGSEFMSYDRNCTYQPNDPCATLFVDQSNIIVTDTCCHSEFSIHDGSVLKGPAGQALKAYSTTFDGNNTIQISN